MRIMPDSDKIEAEYLYAILKTGYGKLLLSSQNMPNHYSWIVEPEHIEGLKIPMFDEQDFRGCTDPTRYGVEDEDPKRN